MKGSGIVDSDDRKYMPIMHISGKGKVKYREVERRVEVGEGKTVWIEG